MDKFEKLKKNLCITYVPTWDHSKQRNKLHTGLLH